ncbi:unnamed protein product [Symbiodinium sp. CCMP2592]|nr:unnamed protein product [Symbiodinium sp. CCMP2592]
MAYADAEDAKALDEPHQLLYDRLSGLLQEHHEAVEKQLESLQGALDKVRGCFSVDQSHSLSASAPGVQIRDVFQADVSKGPSPNEMVREKASMASGTPSILSKLQNALLDQGSSEASELSLPSMNGRSSGESKKTIGFSEEVEVQSPEQPCSPATASMDFQETEEWQVGKTSSVGCNQDTTFPRPSSNSPGQIDRSRALSTSTREVTEMQDQLQMASIRRRSLRVSAVINQLDLNLDEDNWHRGISTGSVLLPTEDLARPRLSKDWVRGVSVGSKSASHSGSPTEERQKRKKEKKKTLFAHEGDENEAMKERARTLAAARDKSAAESSFSAQLGSPITRFERRRYRMRRFLGSPAFEVFVGCLVASNAVIIGMEVEHLAQHLTDLSPEWYQWVHLMYAVVFTVELLLRIGSYGVHIYSDVELFRWAALDFLIVVSSWVDLIAQWSATQESAMTGLAPVRVARVLRITRLIRVTRLAKLMLWLKALRTLLYSVFVTLKSLVWALVLLVLIMYVFAILLTQAATDRIREMQAAPDFEWTDSDLALKDFWGSLGDAVSTLFMSITGGLSWQVAEDPLCRISMVWKGVYFMYIAFTIFAVLNVMTGVFCQSAIESAQRDHDMVMQNVVQEKEGHMRKCRQLFGMLDLDDTGSITITELEERLEDPQVRLFFEALELSIDDVWTFFMLLDGDSGQEIDMEEFLFGCMRLRGNAKALDLAKLMQSHAWMVKKQVDFMMYCEEQFSMMPRLIKGASKRQQRSALV